MAMGGVGLCVAALLLLAPDRTHLLDHFLHHDEALAIFLGRAAMEGQPCGGACAQHTGSVLIHPLLAAWGDDRGGLYGARLVSVEFGLLLLITVVATGWLLMGPVGGWLAGAILLVQAPFLYVSRMALYDIVAAASLGLAVAALVAAECDRAGRGACGSLLVAAVALVAAALAKYVAALFLPAALAVVVWRFRLRQSLLCFVLPVAALGGWYLWQAAPLLGDAIQQARHVTSRGQAGFGLAAVAAMLAHWLRWPLVLALAAFIPAGRLSAGGDAQNAPHRGVWLLLILSAMVIPLLHLATGAVQGLNKNVVLSLVLLAPVAACGLLRLSRPFHLARAVNAQWLVIMLVLAALAWGGLRQKAWLEHQYPDLSPVLGELQPLVGAGMVLMTDTDALFRYALEDQLAPEQVVLTYWVGVEGLTGEAGAVRFVEAQRPDYIVLDGYYGQAAQHERLKAAMGSQYQLRRRWALRLSWGERTVELYERKGATT
jgi:hypothetical protein